jgi:hypothetical protein
MSRSMGRRRGERSRPPFKVVSADWQESDQVLAGIISTSRRRVPSRLADAGRSTADVGPLRNPRVEGRFV